MSIPTCSSPVAVAAEFGLVRKKVTLKETEETWNVIAEGISHLTTLCRNGGCDSVPDMVAGIRSLSRPLTSAMNSERSRLSGTAIDLVSALAIGLGSSFEPLVPLFMPALLGLCGRTNKIFTSRTKACILVLIEHTQLPCILNHLADLATHKSVFPRLTAAEGVLACLNCFNPPDLEKEARARIVEDFIKLTARDANADVRKVSKKIFEAFKTLMPGRVDSFVAPLTPIVKKYLDIPSDQSGRHMVNPRGEAHSHNAAKLPQNSARMDIRARSGGVQHTSQINRPLHLPTRREQPQPPSAAPQGARPDSRSTSRGPQRPTSKASVSSCRGEPSGPVLKGGARRILLPTVDAVPKTGSTRTDRPVFGSHSMTATSKSKASVTGSSGSVSSGRQAKSTTGKPVKTQVKPTSRHTSTSPKASPTTIPLPPSPVPSLEQNGQSSADKPLTSSDLGQRPATETNGTPTFLLAPPSDSPSKTPITALLTSIQRGFLFTPSSPLSPPQTYLPAPNGDIAAEDRSADPSFDLAIPLHRSLKQEFMDAASKQNSMIVDPSIN